MSILHATDGKYDDILISMEENIFQITKAALQLHKDWPDTSRLWLDYDNLEDANAAAEEMLIPLLCDDVLLIKAIHKGVSNIYDAVQEVMPINFADCVAGTYP